MWIATTSGNAEIEQKMQPWSEVITWGCHWKNQKHTTSRYWQNNQKKESWLHIILTMIATLYENAGSFSLLFLFIVLFVIVWLICKWMCFNQYANTMITIVEADILLSPISIHTGDRIYSLILDSEIKWWVRPWSEIFTYGSHGESQEYSTSWYRPNH